MSAAQEKMQAQHVQGFWSHFNKTPSIEQQPVLSRLEDLLMVRPCNRLLAFIFNLMHNSLTDDYS